MKKKANPNINKTLAPHPTPSALGASIVYKTEESPKIKCNNEIASLQHTVQTMPSDHPNFPAYLNNLGKALLARFKLFGDVADLSEAISSHQLAVQYTPRGHSNLPGQLNDLGLAFRTRFYRFGDVGDISESVMLFQRASQLTPESQPAELSGWLNNLGTSLAIRFQRFGDAADLSIAISTQRRGVQLTPEGHRQFLSRLNNLGNSLTIRFQRFGDVGDITEAISSHQRVIQLCPKGHPELPGWLNNLRNSLSIRFLRYGDIADISEAIESSSRAVQLTSEGHPNFPIWLFNLGLAFQTRFDRFGDITDISEAIALHQRAIQLTSDGHPHLPGRLTSLGKSFQTRFERFGDVNDLFQAISSKQRAIKLTPEDHPGLSARLNSLGNSFQTRFESFADEADIEEAIRLQKQAIQLAQKDHPDLPYQLNSLGISYQTCFVHSGEAADLSDAIESLRSAVQLTPDGHPEISAWLNNLGICLQARFKLFGQSADISEAISLQKRAIQLMPDDHFDLSRRLNNLGTSLVASFEHTGDHTIIDSAITNFRLGATSLSSSPFHRLHGARLWAKYSQDYDPLQALEAYSSVINLMSEVAGMEQTVELRHTNLSRMSQLASQAVTVAFSHRRPDLALEWLEQGRCLVWNQLHQLRTTPFHELRKQNPELADKFQQLSAALADAGSRQGSYDGTEDVLERKVVAENAANTHVKTAHEYNQVLEKIRRIPQFHDFLRPRTAKEIFAHLAAAGPIILINIHENRCDALALVSGHNEPLHIPLQNFTHKQAEGLQSQLSIFLSRNGLQMRDAGRGGHPVGVVKQVEIILRALWLAVVRPIFEVLGFDSPEPKPRRIWWCTTGPLASLPIHAAGIYGKGELGVCVSDFAVSSYIPTVSTLIDKIKGTPNSLYGGLLLVSQAAPRPFKTKQGDEETTIALPHIPGVDVETNALKSLMKKANVEYMRVSGDDATIRNVEREMNVYQSIHLACHGTQDFRKPLHSGFFLLDGKLELSDIMKHHNPNAELAFLSACETSTGDEKLSEEAVHLAAGMLAAGYRSVVGTMWSIKDQYGAEVAESFYEALMKSGDERGRGEGQINGGEAARALHFAIQQLRAKVGDTDQGLLTWLPYVHFGI